MKLTRQQYWAFLATKEQLLGLTDAQLSLMKIPKVNAVKNLYSRMAADLEANRRTLDQGTFGPDDDPSTNLCRTPMCIAGHTINLAGEEGYTLVGKVGFATAAYLIHRASRPDVAAPYYDVYPNEWALAYIQERAKEEQKARQRNR